jgi:hypothetical protein
MLKEWARALVIFIIIIQTSHIYNVFEKQYDGADLVSVSVPPNTISFDPAKRVAVLNPEGRAQARSSAPQTPTATVSQPDGLSALASIVKDIRGLLDRTPQTPDHTRTHTCNSSIASHVLESPTLPSPTQLTRFLTHAEAKLGVLDALAYESPLRRKRYGPDILHRVPDSALEDIGLLPGDVLRLKEGVVGWWNGPDAKRKRSRSNIADDREPPPKRTNTISVAYERRFEEGGGSRFSGPPMVAGDYQMPGETLWYRCEARQDWFQVPAGYTVIEDADDEPTS